MTSVKRNGQAKEQLFSIWILERLIDTEKERTRVKTITFSQRITFKVIIE